MNELVLCALLACAVVAESCGRADASEHPPPRIPSGQVWVTAEQVKSGRLDVQPAAVHAVSSEVMTSGKVTFDDLRVSHVFSPVTGRVVRINAEPGQRVKKGDALVVLDSPDVGQAFSDLAKAQADLDQAQHEFKRQEELFRAKAGSERDFEAAKDNFQRTKAELERSRRKARLLSAGGGDQVSQEFTLRSPIDGEVIARSVNPGMEVQGLYGGGTAAELFTIGELDSVWVMADVFEMDLGRLKTGAKVKVRAIAFPDQVFEGKADWVSDALDPTTRTARVRCVIDNPKHLLKPEMFASVTIEVDPRQVLALPRTAVLRLGEQTVVFVELEPAPDGRRRFEERPVAVEEEVSGDLVPVKRGVAAGDRVVVAGAILLSGMLE